MTSITGGVEEVTPTMTTGVGNFVPGFILTTAEPVAGDPVNGVEGSIYFDTISKSANFTISADGTSVGAFDLTALTFLKPFDSYPGYTITITGYRVDGGIAIAMITSGTNEPGFSITDDFSDLVQLSRFTVQIEGTSPEAGVGVVADLSFDSFTVNNIVATPPAPGTPNLTDASDLGTSNTDNITSAAAVAFSGTGPAGDSSSTVRVFIDKNNNGAWDFGTDVGGTATLSNGSWTVSGLSTTGLADGTYKVYGQLSNSVLTGPPSSALNITVDRTAPTLSITSSKASLKAGETATVTFTFSEDPGTTFDASDITVSGGTLSALTTSGAVRTATFTPTAGTNGGTGTITVDAGKFTDAAGNSGGSGTKGISFDTLAPTVTITSDKAAMASGETATITFTFSEDPGLSFSWDGSAGDVVVSGGALSAISGTGLTRTATFTAGSGSTANIALAAGDYADAAGNTGANAGALDITLDTTPPDAPSTPALAAGSDTGIDTGDNLTRTTEPTLQGTAEAGSTVKLYEGATQIGSGTADGSGNWSITVSTLGEGSHNVTAVARDAAGNTSEASGALAFTVDTTSPTLVITSETPVLKAGETAVITFTFSQDPGDTFTWDGSAGDIAVTGGTLSAISGTGAVRTAVFTPIPDTNAGTAGTSVPSGAYTDAAGNAGGAGVTPSLSFDTQTPTVTITSNQSSLKIGETATITFTFTEDPGSSFAWDGSAGDVAASGGTLSAITGSGLARTAVFTPNPDTNGGTASVTIAAGAYFDSVGNGGGAGTTPALTFDTLAPDAPSAPALADGSDTGASTSDGLTNVTAPTFQGTAEAGAQVTLYDGVTAVGSTTADGSGAWAITSSTLAEGSHTVRAVAADAAGNIGAASGSIEVTVDTTAPTLAITSDVSALKAGQTATITFTFSEDPGASFDGGDLVVSGGSLGALSGTGLTRTAVFTPAANTNAGTASITVASGAYADVAGNAGGAGVTPSLAFDTQAPTVAITSDKPSLKIGETATITFTFTEDPGSSFTWDGSNGDVAVSGGTLSAIMGSGLTRTAVFTPNPDTNGGTTSITIAAGAYFDAAGNDGGAGSTPSLAFDTLAPAAPSGPVLDTNSDTGFSSSDHLTSDTTPTITGTAEAGTAVTLYDGATEIGRAVATGGAWSIVTDALADGIHTIVAVATDAAGNTGPSSTSLEVEIDATAPDAPSAPDLVDASDTGDSATDNSTSDYTPTFTGTAAAGATVVLYDSDGTTVLGTTTAAGGVWSITSTSLAVGVHNVTAAAVDAAGNESVLSSALSVMIEAPLALGGGTGSDVLTGGAGDDVLDGGRGRDTMVGGDGDDTYHVDNRRDTVVESTGEGTDHVYATTNIVLAANVENVTLQNGQQAIGNDLDNEIVGNAQGNILEGGLGADTITGGAGRDRFVYKSTADSGTAPGTWDVITDFNSVERDMIDLRAIDANPLKRGEQAFTFIGSAAFSTVDATGQLRFDGVSHMLYGSTDADADAEFAIELLGVTTLTARDFSL